MANQLTNAATRLCHKSFLEQFCFYKGPECLLALDKREKDRTKLQLFASKIWTMIQLRPFGTLGGDLTVQSVLVSTPLHDMEPKKLR